ncbi:MAG: deoxyribonuclease IV [Actinobacteria bacterium]|nr:deoxyribonuclease IV [Actinomycetota bacterium]
MLVGAHVGVAAGYAKAVEYAVSVGCETMQVFAKNPRQWGSKPLDAGVAAEFRDAVARRLAGPVLVHTAYLINLGSADDVLWVKSYVALAEELSRAEMLGATHVVTHTGTEYRGAPERTPERIASAVDRAWEMARPVGVRLLLENTAGAGTTYGDGPKELGDILRNLRAAAGCVGICIDSCHAHAAGWDLAEQDGWPRLLDAISACCGTPAEAVHANDCASGAGLRRDRHAWIGDGTIGYDGFRRLFEQTALQGIPVITEMPGEVPFKDEENVRRLKRLRAASSERASAS